ncbi:MAG: FtsW/RodA/SpoVE family cell cycle protein [Oscillospiraceae bacterium]|nr:FtsW/RodA/SpoVE family cell cycle protein [Oscillospiraceae bacterium]
MSWFTDSVKEFFRKGDLLLLSLCLAASGFGLILVYSATRWLESNRNVIVQLAAILLGVLVYIIMSSVDIELLTERSWKLLLLFNLAIILALIPFGVGAETTGNKSWIPLPVIPVNIQPAEVAKLTFILLFAWQCIKCKSHDISSIPSVMQLTAHTGLMCGLIAYISHDFGMVLTYLLIFVIMAWSAGVKKRWFILAIVVSIVGVVVIWPHVKDLYFAERFTVVIDHLTGNQETLYAQTQGRGWQQSRSILAIGSGGLTGQGFLQGIQTQSSSKEALPARYTDEIFAVCGEEFGLVGCCVLLALLAAIILRCIWIAHQARSPQSALIAIGYAGMLLIQVGVNVGMCLYVFPVVGLTLPFISYGGSSILTMFAAMGIVSGIKMRSLPSWLRDRSQL